MDYGFMSCIFAPDGLIRTGKDHGNEMMDETAIKLRLERELNPGPSGWKHATTELAPGLGERRSLCYDTCKTCGGPMCRKF